MKSHAMRISVIGCGYVGLVTGACLANLGNDVICVDIDDEKVASLRKGIIPFFEPGLRDLVAMNLAQKRLMFTTDSELAIRNSDAIFIAVGTPSREDGSADLSAVNSVAEHIARYMDAYKVVVIKSTVPVGTAHKVRDFIRQKMKKPVDFDVVSNPEFLREGEAVNDFLIPDRIVIGLDNGKAKEVMLSIYKSVERTGRPILVTDVKSSELIKYASNAMLATRISFMNELSHLCEKVGADIKTVAKGIGLDDRIGPRFLQAGIGYGGSCLDGSEEVLIRHKSVIQPVKLNDLFDIFEKEKNIEVLSFDLEAKAAVFRRILYATKRKYDGKIVRVKTRMNRSITATSDHPFIVYDGTRFEVKLAGELKADDRVPLVLNMPFDSNKKVIIDLVDKISSSTKFDLNKVRVRPFAKNFKDCPEIVNIVGSLKTYPGRVRDVLRSNCMTLKEFLTIEDSISNWITRADLLLFTSKGNTTFCPAVIEVDNSLCKLLGYYLSEGNISYDKGRRGTRARIEFHFNMKEVEYVEDVCKILDGLKVRYSIIKRIGNHTNSIIASSRVLAFLLHDILGCGVNCYTAKVPEVIYSANDDQRLLFLSTVFRGDGHISKERNTPAVVYEFGSISEALVNGMITLFHSLGVVPSYKKSKSAKSTDYAHFIRISSRNQIQKLRHFKDTEKQKEVDTRLSNYKKIIKPTGFRKENDNFATVKIKGLETSDAKLDVYSLEVEGTNTFVLTNGVVVHNCFPKDVRALIQMLKENDCSSSLLEAVNSVNEAQKLSVVPKIQRLVPDIKGKKIAIWGLSFKPKTDDMREAPSVTIIKELQSLGAEIYAFDPVSERNARQVLTDVHYSETPLGTLKGVHCLVIVTEWDLFRELDRVRMKELMASPNIVDGRNIYEPAEMASMGFNYIGIGRGG